MKENSKIFFAPEYITAKNKFSAYYAENILPVLHRIEQRRKKHLCIFLLLCCFVASWLGYVFFRLQSGLTDVSGTVAEENGVYGAIGCLLVLFACWPMFSYYKYGKENLLPLLARFFGEFSYSFCPDLPELCWIGHSCLKGMIRLPAMTVLTVYTTGLLSILPNTVPAGCGIRETAGRGGFAMCMFRLAAA